MSDSEESESYSADYEKINGLEYYGEYLVPQEFLGEFEKFSEEDIHPRWRRAPRSAGDFSESKTRSSSCHDSDYEEWLRNYYYQLFNNQTLLDFSEKGTDTCDLPEEKPNNIVTSLFQPVEKDVWSYSTKYWGPKEMRRHWPMRVTRGEYKYLPSIHPHLNLRSRYGRYHSLLNSAAVVPECVHKKYACRLFKRALQGLETMGSQLQQIMVCDTLCNFKWFDDQSKTSITRTLCNVLRSQRHLEKVYIENMGLSRLEGMIFLCALSQKGGQVIKELHLWKMFGHGQNPLLLQELTAKGEFSQAKDPTRFFTRIHYLQILNKFSALTHLSINYAYLANRAGDALLKLRAVRLGTLKNLRLLCIRDERPFRTNPYYGVGGWQIKDGVWRRAVEWCPDLREEPKNVPVNMPQYENVILFLSKSIPVSDVYLSSGMDFTFEVPWDIDSTLLELRNWYAPTLQNLSLHLWHHRDLLDFIIRCKILDEFPNLISFEFIGVLEDIETLEDFCCQLAKGTYKLKTLLFWVEEQHTNEKRLNRTRIRVPEIREKYKKKFMLIDIDADLQTYAL